MQRLGELRGARLSLQCLDRCKSDSATATMAGSAGGWTEQRQQRLLGREGGRRLSRKQWLDRREGRQKDGDGGDGSVDKREVEGCHNVWIGSKVGRAIAMTMAMVWSAGRKEGMAAIAARPARRWWIRRNLILF